MQTFFSLTRPQPDHTRLSFGIRSSLWNTALKSYGNINGQLSIPYEARLSDSPFVEMIWHGHAETDGIPDCPADVFWYLRFLRRNGKISVTVQGPTTKATPVSYLKGDEFLGIRFKPGVFMPHLPLITVTDGMLNLSEDAHKTFWLAGSTWEIPTYENADVLVARLFRTGLLEYDPVIGAALEGQSTEMTLRSVQLRFLRATGLSHKVIQQVERVRYAGVLLEQGTPITEVVFKAGYFDQPHLTRSMRRFFGQTPAQFARMKSYPK